MNEMTGQDKYRHVLYDLSFHGFKQVEPAG